MNEQDSGFTKLLDLNDICTRYLPYSAGNFESEVLVGMKFPRASTLNAGNLPLCKGFLHIL